MADTKFPIKLLLASVFLTILMLCVGLGCSSSDDKNQENESGSSQPEEGIVQILSPNGLYTIDDIIAAGWKKSKELSPETLPDATSVWYGFYKKRDVEVRIYESHDSAINSGIGPAEEATGMGKPDRTGEGAGFFMTRMTYAAYAVVGNLVLMCELDIQDCQGLIDNIK